MNGESQRRDLSVIEADLRELCDGIACFVLHNTDQVELIDPAYIWTAEDRERFASVLFKEASRWVRTFADKGHDPAIVLEAARFLGNQATPVTRDDEAWFAWGLAALLMQFCPRLQCDANLRYFAAVTHELTSRLGV